MSGVDQTEPRGVRILVVDDERRNRQLLEVMLGAEGYTVTTATCASEALEVVAQDPPDLVVLDVMMPGVDGYQVAAQLKGDPATSGIPVILLSALDDRNSRAHGLTSGAEVFLTKPVNREELSEEVRRLLQAT